MSSPTRTATTITLRFEDLGDVAGRLEAQARRAADRQVDLAARVTAPLDEEASAAC